MYTIKDGFSLLAREINWLETHDDRLKELRKLPNSLLAREINWLETTGITSSTVIFLARLLPTR